MSIGLILVLVAATAVAEGMQERELTVAEVASEDGRFETLVAALDAADLVDTLNGEGPFTVFAPTDDAFAKLPDGTVEALLNDIPTLTQVLLYHVVSGRVPASDVVGLSQAETVQGQPVVVSVSGSTVRVNDAMVTQTDVMGSNGLIHVIDSVILPPTMDLVGVAVNDRRFSTLAAAVEAAGLIDTLQSEGPFTVFAPTDEAFGKLPDGTVEALLQDIPTLTDILLYHVVPGRVVSGDVVSVDSAASAQGASIGVSVNGGSVLLNGDSRVVETDILATNGVVHVIDSVILPPSN
jgi:uncharacterized surface protein with fasciclin (FAS1) repeats